MSGAQFLKPDEFRSLNRQSPIRATEGILRSWLPVLATFAGMRWLQEATPYWPAALPLAWLIIASRQHAFALHIHDCAHRSVFRNKRLNDLVGRYLFSFPLLVSFSRYRAIHMTHHRALYTEQDPDLAIFTFYPVTPEKFRRILGKDLTGRTVLKNLFYFAGLPRFLMPARKAELKIPDHEPDSWKLGLFQAALIAALAWTGWLLEYALLWLIPYATLFQVLLRIRGALEHAMVEDREDPLRNTRTVISNPVVLTWLAPLGLNYHLEHHLYPTVPWYRLRRLHELLSASPRGAAAKISVGYLAAMRELLR